MATTEIEVPKKEDILQGLVNLSDCSRDAGALDPKEPLSGVIYLKHALAAAFMYDEVSRNTDAGKAFVSKVQETYTAAIRDGKHSTDLVIEGGDTVGPNLLIHSLKERFISQIDVAHDAARAGRHHQIVAGAPVGSLPRAGHK